MKTLAISPRGLFLPVFLLAHPTRGYTNFQPTCTVPNETVNFVASAGVRGTFDILWSCLFTILACTWSIQHLNIPEQRDRHKETSKRWGATFWYDTVWAMKRFWTNFKWMVIAILAPEMILGKAIADLMTARDLTQNMRERAEKDGMEWSLTHSSFLLMGGFRFEKTTNGADTDPPGADIDESPPETVVLTPGRLLSLEDDLGSQAIPHLPKISGDEIRDKSKSNLFVKVVAVIQVVWVTVQVIVRTSRGLPVSQLELVVTAFSACAVLSYLVLIPKPQGVEILAPSIPVSGSHWRRVKRETKHTTIHLRNIFIPGLDEYTIRRSLGTVANDAICVETSRDTSWYAFGISASGVLFGAIHIAGWNFDFPSLLDRMLWHVSSILLVVLLPPSLLPFFLNCYSSTFSLYVITTSRERFTQMFALVCGCIYTLARLALLVETFRSLAYMLPQAYVSTWAENVPHFG